MKKEEMLLGLFIILLIIFSCRNKPVRSPETKTPGNRQTADSSAVRINPSSTPLFQETGMIQDIEGNDYKTIKIGDQTWMVKNLKTTRFNNGTPIPLVADSTKWASLSSPAYCWYENDQASFKPSYGALYNGYAVSSGKLCPVDWHVPSDADWTKLSTFLGGEPISGGKLKAQGTTFWVTPNTGATNQSGFTALPGGLRFHDGLFHDFGFSGYWWSSTEPTAERAYFRYADYEYSVLFRFENLKKIGFSVRCIRDY